MQKRKKKPLYLCTMDPGYDSYLETKQITWKNCTLYH